MSLPPTLLPLARRLDWRFLLPDPTLRRVGYLGPARDPLCEALAHFSDSYHLLESTPSPAPLDLLVARATSPTVLAPHLRALRAGGWLYWELPDYPARLRAAGARTVARACRWLHARGLEQLQAHWHWPTHARATRLIPLDNGDALRYVLASGGTTPVGRLWRALFRRAAPHRGWHALIPAASIIGQWQGAP